MPNPPSLFDKPSEASTSLSALDNYVQPNLGYALRIWWAFYWPTTLVTIVLSIGLTIALKAAYEDMNVPAKYVALPMRYNSYVLAYVVAFFGLYYILHKNFRHFRIGLLPQGAPFGATPLPATMRRTIRVWWTYSWRTLVYGLAAWVVVILPLTWFLGIFGPGPVFAALFFGVIGLIAGGAVALFVIYSSILDEDLGDFRVCLLPRHVISGEPISSPSNFAPNQL